MLGREPRKTREKFFRIDFDDCKPREALLALASLRLAVLPRSDLVRVIFSGGGITVRFEIEGCGDAVNGMGDDGDVGSIGDDGVGVIPVTCLQNVAMARKQNLAGVVNENKTGNTCAASRIRG